MHYAEKLASPGDIIESLHTISAPERRPIFSGAKISEHLNRCEDR